MGRKLEVMEAKTLTLENIVAHEVPLKEQVLFTGSNEWTPEEAEHYIDRRIQLLDLEISRVRERLDDLIGARKRWLAVTGGRSKMFSNGNGHAVANGA